MFIDFLFWITTGIYYNGILQSAKVELVGKKSQHMQNWTPYSAMVHPVWTISQGLCLFLMNGSFWKSDTFLLICWQMHRSNCSSCWQGCADYPFWRNFSSVSKHWFFLLWRLYWCTFTISSRWTGNHIWASVKGSLLMRDPAMFFVLFALGSILMSCLHAEINWTGWIDRRMYGW